MLLSNVKNTVVVPFDFSDLSIEALRKTIEMVEDPSLIQVIHVAEYPSAYEYGVVWQTIQEDTIVEKIRESFQKVISEAGGFPELKLTLAFGNPGAEICRFAKELAAELIVMPSHGRSGFERFLLGSVAERVLRSAHCPVLILRQLIDEAEAAELAEDSSMTALI